VRCVRRAYNRYVRHFRKTYTYVYRIPAGCTIPNVRVFDFGRDWCVPGNGRRRRRARKCRIRTGADYTVQKDAAVKGSVLLSVTCRVVNNKLSNEISPVERPFPYVRRTYGNKAARGGREGTRRSLRNGTGRERIIEGNGRERSRRARKRPVIVGRATTRKHRNETAPTIIVCFRYVNDETDRRF